MHLFYFPSKSSHSFKIIGCTVCPGEGYKVLSSFFSFFRFFEPKIVWKTRLGRQGAAGGLKMQFNSGGRGPIHFTLSQIVLHTLRCCCAWAGTRKYAMEIDCDLLSSFLFVEFIKLSGEFIIYLFYLLYYLVQCWISFQFALLTEVLLLFLLKFYICNFYVQ